MNWINRPWKIHWPKHIFMRQLQNFRARLIDLIIITILIWDWVWEWMKLNVRKPMSNHTVKWQQPWQFPHQVPPQWTIKSPFEHILNAKLNLKLSISMRQHKNGKERPRAEQKKKKARTTESKAETNWTFVRATVQNTQDISIQQKQRKYHPVKSVR